MQGWNPSIRSSERVRRHRILKAVARTAVDRVRDETLILADQADKDVSQVRESVQELLTDKIPPEKVEHLAKLLSEGTWTHDHPITYETAKSFGRPVRDDIPPEFLDLMSLYPQPVRRQPTVEHLCRNLAAMLSRMLVEKSNPYLNVKNRAGEELPLVGWVRLPARKERYGVMVM
jgi:hypothetical protein